MVELGNDREKFVTHAGIFSFCFQVCWRTVFWGLGLQFIFGILVIRTEPGFNAFQWLGDQMQVQGIEWQSFLPQEPQRMSI